ncbi:MAG: winged helix-turn-helix domain-containing protein [Oscillospiraceae bacterium]|nr:winged helix-turn-helix domain-containing protein [Oscillospiraceae bacterium]
MLQDVWKSVNLGEARTVDTHIKNLRMKLGQCGAQLKTIRGSGYLLEA